MRTKTIQAENLTLQVVDLPAILGDLIHRLPVTLRLLCENHIRTGGAISPMLDAMAQRQATTFEFAFRPNRLLMHDTTCTPALADVAGLRDALAEAGTDPNVLSPTLPIDVSVDHSLAVDAFASPDAFQRNARNEFARNSERYAFMKWASLVMEGVHVHPPGTGIMHTINLEQLASVLHVDEDGFAHPDMLLGTDSHTPMINGIGVLAWGIGGLEAESIMFGQSVSLAVPKVIGVRLSGHMPEGSLASDLALHVTHRLRAFGATGEFVEFFGPGVATLSADTRAVVANMAPEYGASTGFFPCDEATVAYLARTGRAPGLCNRIEPVFRQMGLWFDPEAEREFDRQIEIDLSTIEPTIAGPRRPQDTCQPGQAARRVEEALGRGLSAPKEAAGVPDGAVGIAAITSCTNTSDPALLIAAGLLARAARQRGLRPKPWVKTSLAPGSPSARGLLKRAGLEDDLSDMGFDIVGHGCTTCIGNSGALPEVIETALDAGRAVTAVLSGNRNFPGRVHPKLDLGFLASPPLVIAYSLRGHIQGDILNEPVAISSTGEQVMLADIWPQEAATNALLTQAVEAEDVRVAFASASTSVAWEAIPAPETARFPWDPKSRYLRRPAFASRNETSRLGEYEACPLLVLGDDITTDHISPAGAIASDSAAARWLVERDGDPGNLNVYAAYRGNWEVMLRGLFTNRLVKNHLRDDLAPSETLLDDGRVLPVFEAAEVLTRLGKSTVILAGERYGMGSSRDWAAKGVALLNVRAVIAKSFERIHRTNLIGMGILPLAITDGFDPASAGLSASDRIQVKAGRDDLDIGKDLAIRVLRADGMRRDVQCRAAIETQQELDLLRAGGVLSNILKEHLS